MPGIAGKEVFCPHCKNPLQVLVLENEQVPFGSELIGFRHMRADVIVCFFCFAALTVLPSEQ